MQQQVRPRRYDYDLIRVCAMLGVVYLHVAAGALRVPQNGPVWHFSNLITSLATVAVPLFFMLSGALLLSGGRTGDLSYLLKKRLPRVLVPLLAWSAVVLLLTGLRGGAAAAFQKLFPILNSPVLVPYWFIYALVPIYLVSPLLKKLVENLPTAHWRYLLLLWAVLTLGFNTLVAFLPEALKPAATIHWTFNLNFVGGYLGYFLLGYYLDRLARAPSRTVLWWTAGASYLVIVLGTWWDTARTGGYLERFKSYVNLFAAVLAVSVFLLARSYWKDHKPGGRPLVLLSGVSFGVYLVHPLAIEAIRLWWPRIFTGGMAVIDTIGEQLLFYGIVCLSCVAGTVLLASVKPLCYLFTGQRFSEACRESNLFALFRTSP